MHIAHLRTYYPADIYVRYQRKLGKEVVFVSGSDTHGTPITVKAEELGSTPEKISTYYHEHFKEIFPKLGIFFDNYGNTDGLVNRARTIEIATRLIEKDLIYPKNVTLPFCPTCQRFLPDRYMVGDCPHCGAEARGDECDQGCGRYLEPGEIQSPRCVTCGTPAEFRETKHYFLRLSSFEEFLSGYLETFNGTENARNYAKGWLEGGLNDWNITRNIEWGIPFPGSDDLTFYVWFDAPIEYISSTEEWSEETGGDWTHFWKGTGEIIHFIGSDIIYHHCLFWPSMLKGSGYTPADSVVASGMVKIDGRNFSKSRGYVIWVEDEYLEENLDPDALRYYIASYTGHTRDLDFSWKTYAEKLNKELVGIIGNFLYRSLLFAFREYGVVPSGVVDSVLESSVLEVIDQIQRNVKAYEFKKISDAILGLASRGNRYLQENEPWKLLKIDPDRAQDVIYNCLWLSKAISILGEPIFPFHSYELFRQLGLEQNNHNLTSALDPLKPGKTLHEPKPLFSQISSERVTELQDILSGRVTSLQRQG